MENEINQLEEDVTLNTESKQKIYSKKAIWGFSVIFTSIFGGVLLFQNLKDIGKKKEANLILLYSILYTIVTIYLVNIPDKPKSGISFMCNMVGGYILSEYFFNKYFLNPDDYDKKKIWKPLIISILIIIPFIFVLIYSGTLDK